MKRTIRIVAMVTFALAAIAATSVQAAVILIPDYSLVPDGTDYGKSNNWSSTEDQRTAVNGNGTIVNGTIPIAYYVTTLIFGAGTSAEMNLNFTANVGQDRLGVKVRANGTVSSTGDGSDSSSDYDFGGSLAGESVTIIGKFDYDANYSDDYGHSNASDDTFATFWINPTGSDTEGSGWTLLPGNPPTTPNPSFTGDFASGVWNSSSFYLLKQRIYNNSTPSSAGTSSITDTVVLTGSDATFANALALAVVPEPGTFSVMAIALGLLAVRRRFR